MSNRILFVGLDVDAKAFHAAIICSEGKDLGEFRCKPSIAHLVKRLEKVSTDKTIFRICYESTYLGFSLARSLRQKGYSCEMIAVSSIPRTPGAQVKTDRIDARKIAAFYRSGLLSVVHIPELEDEAVRDLVRTRGFIVEQVKATKQHILSLIRRSGRDFKEEVGQISAQYWTKLHREWLLAFVHSLENEALKANLTYLQTQLKQLERQVELYDAEIERWSLKPQYIAQSRALQCFRGIDTQTAMTLLTELGDIDRFPHPKNIVSYVGLDISEYSSGGKHLRYSITHQGNKFIRTALVEAAQHASLPVRVSTVLSRRRKEADPQSIEIADRCMHRLSKKSLHLLFRGKARNKVKVACAREMVGFIWETLRQVKAAQGTVVKSA